MATQPGTVNLGTSEQFAAVRELLTRANFTEAAICERLGIPAFISFKTAVPKARISEGSGTGFDILAQLFLACEPVGRAEAAALLGDVGMSSMEALALITADAADGARIVATVGLAPTRGLWLVSDRGGELATLAGDVVYPAILENTQDFLSIIPDTPCESFLDLGAGTGVAALVAARGYAREAWACDITARATLFAEFNRRLNGLPNVTIAQGDLYDPVKGRRFQRIVSHPPYVPVSRPTCVFRDGGDDGEQIVRRIVEGLPDYLAPGGRFYGLTLLSDREGEAAEARIRRWLGDSHREFDVAVIAETAREPFDFIGRAMQKGTHYPEELQYWGAVYRELGVKYLVYGSVIVQRHTLSRDPFTLRLQKGPRSGPKEAEWAMRWHTEAYEAGAGVILDSRLRLSPELNMAVLHRVRDGSLTAEEFLLRVQYPFESECKCPKWCAALVLACDGARTGAQILDSLKADGVVNSDTASAEFSEVIKVLLGAGFLEATGSNAPEPVLSPRQ